MTVWSVRRGRLVGPVATVMSVALLAGCGESAVPATEPTDTVSAAPHPRPTSVRATETVTVTPPAATVTVRPGGGEPVDGTPVVGVGPLLAASALGQFEARFGDAAAVAVAPLNGGEIVTTGDARSPYAWSTAKVLIVALTLQDADGPDGLNSEQRDLIERALSSSDNEAAAALHRELEARHGGLQGAADAMTALLRRAGDSSTEVSTIGRDTYSTYGQTLWSAAEQARFMAALMRGCVLPDSSTQFLRDQMGNVVSDQRWGLGDAGSPAFKGGWGPDPDGQYLVRQLGVLRAADGNDYAVAITARPDDGSFQGGQQLLTEVAQWLNQQVVTAPAPASC